MGPKPPPEPGDDEGMPRHGNPKSPRCRWCGLTKWRKGGIAFCPTCDKPPKE